MVKEIKKERDVSIIIPAYRPDKKILAKINSSLRSQKYTGKTEIILVDKGWGFSKQMNWGIMQSKYEIVIILPQDCVPSSKLWLHNLLEPFNRKEVVASVSKVTFPSELWNNSTNFTKSLIIKERGTITSSLDGKGSAYRKSSLKEIGLFDEKTFRTAGEDFDTYLKLRDKGTIVYPNAEIIHYHPTTTLQRLKKIRQYSNGYGALTRIYGFKMYKWYGGILLAVPFLGLIGLLAHYPLRKGLAYFPHYLLISPLVHFQYMRGFWKGFFLGRQTV